MAKLKIFTDEQGNKLDEMEIKKRQRSGKGGDIALQNLKKQQATKSSDIPSWAQQVIDQHKNSVPGLSDKYKETYTGTGDNPKDSTTNTRPEATAPIQPVQPVQPKPAGMRVGNSNKDVANAKPGDWIIRKDGSKYILKPGDIAWAKSKFVKSAPAPANVPVPTTKPEASAIQVTNKPNAEYVPNTNPDHKRESVAKRRILEEKKNTPYQHMSDNDYLHAVSSGSLKHPGLKVTPVQGSDGYYNYTFN